MKNSILVAAFAVFYSAFSFAQGTLKGNIKSENGDTLFGANISLKENPFIGTTTDANGSYSFKIPDSLTHVITVTFVGYGTVEDTLRVKKGEVLVRNYVMKVKAYISGGAGITKTKNKTKDTYMDEVKQK